MRGGELGLPCVHGAEDLPSKHRPPAMGFFSSGQPPLACCSLRRDRDLELPLLHSLLANLTWGPASVLRCDLPSAFLARQHSFSFPRSLPSSLTPTTPPPHHTSHHHHLFSHGHTARHPQRAVSRAIPPPGLTFTTDSSSFWTSPSRGCTSGTHKAKAAPRQRGAETRTTPARPTRPPLLARSIIQPPQ